MATKKNQADKAAAAAKREARRVRNERAKAAAEARRRAQRRKERLTLVGVVAAVLVLIGGGYLLVRVLNPSKPDIPPAGATDSYGFRVGEADAPKEVVIYEDFLCRFCGDLEEALAGRLDPAVEAGELSVEYRPLPFLDRYGDYSQESANAFAVVLDASGPEVAREFHHLLFENRPPETGPHPDEDDLVELAVQAGAEESEVRPGIEDGAFEGWVEAAGEAASKDGVSSTPSVFIDGERIEYEDLSEVATAILGPAG